MADGLLKNQKSIEKKKNKSFFFIKKQPSKKLNSAFTNSKKFFHETSIVDFGQDLLFKGQERQIPQSFIAGREQGFCINTRKSGKTCFIDGSRSSKSFCT